MLIGLGLSGTTFPVIFGALSRLVAPEKRSLAMGITLAVGSFGQFVMLPVSLGLIAWLDWHGALVGLSVIALAMIPLAWGLREAPLPADPAIRLTTAREAPAEALGARDFWLLTLGFFACGFQVVFIAVHLPAYITDGGLGMTVATTTLALIGLVNIAGAWLAGYWGGRMRKPMLLA